MSSGTAKGSSGSSPSVRLVAVVGFVRRRLLLVGRSRGPVVSRLLDRFDVVVTAARSQHDRQDDDRDRGHPRVLHHPGAPRGSDRAGRTGTKGSESCEALTSRPQRCGHHPCRGGVRSRQMMAGTGWSRLLLVTQRTTPSAVTPVRPRPTSTSAEHEPCGDAGSVPVSLDGPCGVHGPREVACSVKKRRPSPLDVARITRRRVVGAEEPARVPVPPADESPRHPSTAQNRRGCRFLSRRTALAPSHRAGTGVGAGSSAGREPTPHPPPRGTGDAVTCAAGGQPVSGRRGPAPRRARRAPSAGPSPPRRRR
jgi:hypothetical protein